MSEEEKGKEEEITSIQKAAVEIVKYLYKNFPDSRVNRIEILKDLLEIEFKAFSFCKLPFHELEILGMNLINGIYSSLLSIWKEDKKHRIIKGKKDE